MRCLGLTGSPGSKLKALRQCTQKSAKQLGQVSCSKLWRPGAEVSDSLRTRGRRLLKQSLGVGSSNRASEGLFPDGARLVACLGFCHSLSSGPVPASCFIFKNYMIIYTQGEENLKSMRVSDENKICLYPSFCSWPCFQGLPF